MAKLNWEIVRECDLDDGTPTEWVANLGNMFVWIDVTCDGTYEVVISHSRGEDGSLINIVYTSLVECKTLTSAKRWAARYL